MRRLYVTLGFAGWLLLAVASLRLEVVEVQPKNGRPYTVRRIVWPWESGIPKEFKLQQEGEYDLNRYSFFGLHDQGCSYSGTLGEPAF